MNIAVSLLIRVAAMATTLVACTSTTRVKNIDHSSDASADGAAGAGGTSEGGGAAGSGATSASGGSGATGALGGSGGLDGSAGDAGSADAGACPLLPGPRLVPIDGFCIDRTEVTGQQYEDFVNAKNGDMSGQIAECSGNASYIPSGNWPIPSDYLDKPVIYVDWCDAYAYCAWAGKRLCGKIGGGSNPYDAYADANSSQWYRVCSNGGRNVFPYGSTFDDNACNGCAGFCDIAVVASFPACQGVGAYAGVFDLSGNVLEWEDSCGMDATEGEVCRSRGGSIYAAGELDLTCDTDVFGARLETAPGIGFRCCYQ